MLNSSSSERAETKKDKAKKPRKASKNGKESRHSSSSSDSSEDTNGSISTADPDPWDPEASLPLSQQSTSRLTSLYHGYSSDQRELNQTLMPGGGWDKDTEQTASECWETRVIECHQRIMSKQGISKGASMHHYSSIRGHPNTINHEA